MPEYQDDRSILNRTTSPDYRSVKKLAVSRSFSPDFDSVKKRLSISAHELLTMDAEIIYNQWEGKRPKEINQWWLNQHNQVSLPLGLIIYNKSGVLSQYENIDDFKYLKLDILAFEKWFWNTAKNRLIDLADDLQKLGFEWLEKYAIIKKANIQEKDKEIPSILVDFQKNINTAIDLENEIRDEPILTIYDGRTVRINKGVVEYISPDEFEKILGISPEKFERALNEGKILFPVAGKRNELNGFINLHTFEHKIFKSAWECIGSKHNSLNINQNFLDIDQTKSLIKDTINKNILSVAENWKKKLYNFEELEKGEWRIFDAFLRKLIDDLAKAEEIDEPLKNLCTKIIEWNFETVKESKSWGLEFAEIAIFVLTLLLFRNPSLSVAATRTLLKLNAISLGIDAKDWADAIARRKEIENFNKAELVQEIYEVTSKEFRSEAGTRENWAMASFIMNLVGCIADLKRLKKGIPIGPTVDGAENSKLINNLTDPEQVKNASNLSKKKVFSAKPKTPVGKSTDSKSIDNNGLKNKVKGAEQAIEKEISPLSYRIEIYNAKEVKIFNMIGNPKKDMELIEKGYLLDISNFRYSTTGTIKIDGVDIPKRFPIRSLDPDFKPDKILGPGNKFIDNVDKLSNRQLTSSGRVPYLRPPKEGMNPIPVELHHYENNFFNVREMSRSYHQTDFTDLHGFLQDPVGERWRGPSRFVWYERNFRTLGEIHDILRELYWKARW